MTGSRVYAKAPAASGPTMAPKRAPAPPVAARQRTAAPAGEPLSIQAQLAWAARFGGQLGDVSVQGPPLADRIRGASAGGRPLSPGLRGALEPRLGAGLSAVRLHTDAAADALARAVDAVAFTTGPNIFFRAGAFNPRTPEGLGLLAHEAEHTRQQARGPVAGAPAPGGVALSDPADRFERAADAAAARVREPTAVSGGPSAPSGAPFAPGVANGAARGPGGSAAPAAVQRSPLLPVQRFPFIPRGKFRGLLPQVLGTPGKSMYSYFYGKEAARRTNEGVKTETLNSFGIYGKVEDVAIPSTNGNTLRGRYYTPKPSPDGTPRPGDGETVLILSGSGGSAETFTEPVARQYASLGARVLAVNYRGFGQSSTRVQEEGVGGAPSQAGLYEDAMAMFTYLRKDRNVKAKDIVVHGYSLGGGVAAELVSALAAQRIRVRGLVLHSAIPSGAEPAQAQLGGGAIGAVAGALTSGFIGKFDTRKKLARIAARYPDLPTHFLSGAATAPQPSREDHLAISTNNLAQLELNRPGRTNVTATEATGGHLDVREHLQDPRNQAALGRILNSDAYQQYQRQHPETQLPPSQVQQVQDVVTSMFNDQALRAAADEDNIRLALLDLQGQLGRPSAQGAAMPFQIRRVLVAPWPAPIEIDVAYVGLGQGGAFDAKLAERQVRDAVAAVAGGPVRVRLRDLAPPGRP